MFGFCFGLFADTALMQTLGVTSLVLTAVGYGAGPRSASCATRRTGSRRSRSARRPPLATALGVTLLQFLLGSRRRCRCRSGAPDPDDVVSTRCSRCRSTRCAAARCSRSCPTTRAAGAAARTRPAASARSRAHEPEARGAPPGDHAAARGPRRRARRLRVRAVRDRLLPPVVPPGADRRGLRQPGARQPRPQGPDRGAARRHRGPQRPHAGQDPRRAGRAGRPEPAAGDGAGARRHLPRGAREGRGGAAARP